MNQRCCITWPVMIFAVFDTMPLRFDKVPFLPRDAMLSAVHAIVVCPSVCQCVCVSVTLRYCIKTDKRRITEITPHDSPLTLVFWHQRSLRNSKGITPFTWPIFCMHSCGVSVHSLRHSPRCYQQMRARRTLVIAPTALEATHAKA